MSHDSIKQNFSSFFIDKILLLFHLKHVFSLYPFQIQMYLLYRILHMEITGYRNMKIPIFYVFCMKADFWNLSYRYLWINTKHFSAVKSSNIYFASNSWTNMILSLQSSSLWNCIPSIHIYHSNMVETQHCFHRQGAKKIEWQKSPEHTLSCPYSSECPYIPFAQNLGTLKACWSSRENPLGINRCIYISAE